MDKYNISCSLLSNFDTFLSYLSDVLIIGYSNNYRTCISFSAIGDYEPIKVQGKLDLSLLGHDSTTEDIDLQESVPNTPRDAHHQPVIPPTPGSGDTTNMSIEMDMSMDDL